MFLFYLRWRQDISPLEVFFGLYKDAAILHFSVNCSSRLAVICLRREWTRAPRWSSFSDFAWLLKFWKWSLLSGIRVDGLSLLTRVGYTIQTIRSTEVTPFFVGFCLIYQQEWRRLCVRLPGMLLPQLASQMLFLQIFGIRQPAQWECTYFIAYSALL